MSLVIILNLLIVTCTVGCAKKPEPAELVVTNAKIVTMDESRPQAEALAARCDKIVALGTAKEIDRYIGPATEVIDLQGKLAVPGLIDAHLHFSNIGQTKLGLDLTKAKNWHEIVAMVAAAVKKAKPGEWILGRGWHQEKWDKVPQPNIQGLPLHAALSKVTPNNPVMLTHASGHSCLANAKAMALANVTAKTPNPPGGEIYKDAKGNPIGAFLENAQDYIDAALLSWQQFRTGEEKEAERWRIIELACAECLSKGIVGAHDAGVSFNDIDFFKKAAYQGKLGIRLNVMIEEDNENLRKRLTEYKLIGYAANHLTVRSIKRLIDGALGSHGAWLLETYADLPTSNGLNTESIDDMKETARIAIENGFQLCTHAIGDRANREILNIYEEAFKAHPGKKDLRWRIEHAQHLNAADIPRFGRLGVIAAMQGVHCTSDGPWIVKYLGTKRAEEGAYVWRKLLDSGAVIANGTDAPVEDVDPLPVFYASVTRKLKNGNAFYPAQRMTREEALRSYTLNAAYAAFEEGVRGSLMPGKLADITVFSQDIMTCPEEKILATRVLYTIVGGKVLYKK
jgi:hypothetical protein